MAARKEDAWESAATSSFSGVRVAALEGKPGVVGCEMMDWLTGVVVYSHFLDADPHGKRDAALAPPQARKEMVTHFVRTFHNGQPKHGLLDRKEGLEKS